MTRILIVDDERTVVDGLAEIIGSWNELGIQGITTAYDGIEALRLLEDSPFDILITDIRMPGMSGLELIERINAVQPSVKCILLTGYSEFEYAKQAIQLQAIEYMLKPVNIDLLKTTLEKAAAERQRDLERNASYEQAMTALKENLPALRERFLYELLQGIRFPGHDVEKKLELLDLPVPDRHDFYLMIIRMEGNLSHYSSQDVWLIEYALHNIVGEVLGERFRLWHTKDEYGYIVYVLIPNGDGGGDAPEAAEQSVLETFGTQIQSHIKQYLQCPVSILFSQRDVFPTSLKPVYENAVTFMLQKIGGHQEIILSLSPVEGANPIKSVVTLQEPPSFIHLLQHGKWETAKEKLHRVCSELVSDWRESQEHLWEVSSLIVYSFLYIAHKNGKTLSEICGTDTVKAPHPNLFLSAKQLEEWSLSVIDRLMESVNNDVKGTRSSIIRKVQQYVNDHLSDHISLDDIASHVYMHPSTLSKMYRSETGHSISETIFRIRMEKAEYLLIRTRDKVKTIASALGYQNTAYFIKVFREYSGMTPQEYRNRS